MCWISYCVGCVNIRLCKSYLSRHTMLAVSLKIHSMFLNDLTSEKIRHYVLGTILCLSGVYLVIEEWLNQTYCVRCVTKIHLGCFKISPVENSDTMC